MRGYSYVTHFNEKKEAMQPLRSIHLALHMTNLAMRMLLFFIAFNILK